MGAYITTYSGIHFDLVKPTTDMVRIEDIAHHLGYVCRWAGATSAFWSVAQHSVLLTYITPPHLHQWALMHDAAEAYIGDVTRPLKNLLPGIREIEKRIEDVIATRFGLSPCPPELSVYDDQIQRFEGELFLPQHDGKFFTRQGAPADLLALRPDQERQIPNAVLKPMSQNAAEILFLLRYKDLFNQSAL